MGTIEIIFVVVLICGVLVIGVLINFVDLIIIVVVYVIVHFIGDLVCGLIGGRVIYGVYTSLCGIIVGWYVFFFIGFL